MNMDRAGQAEGEQSGAAARPPLQVVEADLAAPTEPTASLLQDAAVVVAARQELDALVGQLCAQPFSPATHNGLRAYLAGPAARACAAYERVCAATTMPGR